MDVRLRIRFGWKCKLFRKFTVSFFPTQVAFLNLGLKLIKTKTKELPLPTKVQN